MGSFNVDLGDSGDSLADLPEQDGGTSISIQSLWDTLCLVISINISSLSSPAAGTSTRGSSTEDPR